MLVVGLTGDKTVTPSVVADYATQNHYVDENNDTTWAFMTSGVEHWGLTCRESNGNESEIAKGTGGRAPGHLQYASGRLYRYRTFYHIDIL